MPVIYHITPVDNLQGIIKKGGLYCDHDAKKIEFVSIGHKHIKERREGKKVPKGPGGVVSDYVPFYFAPRSPMLYVIHRGGVEGYGGGQTPIIHLCSSTDAVDGAGLGWVFTEGQAAMGYTDFFDDFKDLPKVDWPLMQAIYWRDTDDDPDRCRRRQAEFLVHKFFPWKLVSKIGVCNTATAQKVSEILDGKGPTVEVRQDWYY